MAQAVARRIIVVHICAATLLCLQAKRELTFADTPDLGIRAAIARHHGLSAIHSISHVVAGELQIGKTDFDATQLEAEKPYLAQVGKSLAVDGDILLYGCRISAGGQEFLAKFAQLTDLDVTASNYNADLLQ